MVPSIYIPWKLKRTIILYNFIEKSITLIKAITKKSNHQQQKYNKLETETYMTSLNRSHNINLTDNSSSQMATYKFLKMPIKIRLSH